MRNRLFCTGLYKIVARLTFCFLLIRQGVCDEAGARPNIAKTVLILSPEKLWFGPYFDDFLQTASLQGYSTPCRCHKAFRVVAINNKRVDGTVGFTNDSLSLLAGIVAFII